jgi:ribosomal protein S24E
MGGLSHHEIVGISNLQTEISAQIVPGSNEIYSSSQFLNQLETLHRPDKEKEFTERILKGASTGNNVDL